MLLADRFLQCGTQWIDAATARAVQVVLRPAGRRREQIDWVERCAMLAALRHPLLNPLIDFGVASSSSFFEAYDQRAQLRLPRASVPHLVSHAMRFLDAHGVSGCASLTEILLRPIAAAAGEPLDRPIGIVLQHREAVSSIVEAMSAAAGNGTVALRLAAGADTGLRTTWLELARRARLEGFVAIAPETLRRWPQVAAHISSRHFCVMTNAGSRGDWPAAAALLARASRHGVRCNVWLTAERTDERRAGAVHLEPMGRNAMTSMVYVDPEYGPPPADILAAVRWAGGAPGRFVRHLASAGATGASQTLTLHETPAVYEGSEGSGDHRVPRSAPSEQARSRIASVLWRAASRAAALHARGRHGAAARLLARAARALEGRGETSHAARHWVQLAWLARSRGALAAAHQHAEEAARVDVTAPGQLAAGLVRAVCWTDERRFLQAEAALRTLLVSASAVDDAAWRGLCETALGRVLYWAGRLEEAHAALEGALRSERPEVACAASIVRARLFLATGDIATAVQTARAVLDQEGPRLEPRLVIAAHRVLAECGCAAHDLDRVRVHVSLGVNAAVAARLPLAVLRLRAVLLLALESAGRHQHERTEAARLRLVLQRSTGRRLPAIVLQALNAALQPPLPMARALTPPSARSIPVEMFLDLAHRAKDDEEAVKAVAGEVLKRVGGAAIAVIATSGRVVFAEGLPWRERSIAVVQALTSGNRVAFDPARQPPEAAEPIHCGGDLIGALACRWASGSTAVPGFIADSLRAASLSIATHLRQIVDSTPAPPPGVWGDLLGESSAAITLRDAVHRAARAPFPVLVEGESGSGKELVARAVHKLSPRHTRRFCAINCAALGDDLIEAELFGHTRGAFTGAACERAGLFEESDGGTLFLDEIGELSPRAQAKLLRVLQEGEVRRIGENLPRRVDVRIVAATNRCLEREAAEGRFRVDLRFRLDVLRISVPPLRERATDVPLLAQHFWRTAITRVGSQATLGQDALAALSRYDWPGNVRELQNAIAWMAVHAPRRGRVSATLLPAQLATAPMTTGSSFDAAREEFERRFVRAALARAGGQRQAAARALGVSRQGLAKMLRRLGIPN
jgi:DNA-binding NtrC family response regulator/tetratricopeptide (TPR) repeat protein